MITSLLFLCFFLVVSPEGVNSLKALVIAPPGYGHIYAPMSLVHELTQKGHEATLLVLDCPFFNFTFSSPPHLSVKTLTIPCDQSKFKKDALFFFQLTTIISTLNSLELLKLVKEEILIYQPDVVVVDFFLIGSEALSRSLNIPTAVLNFAVPDVFIESYIPAPFSDFSAPLSFPQRVGNVLFSAMFRWLMYPALIYWSIPDVKELGIEWPSLPSMMIVAGEYGMFPARAVPPYVKVVGPLITPKRQPHDEELEKLLEEMGKTSKAVVYVSFGTVWEVPAEALRNLVDGLGNVTDVQFLWAVTQRDVAATLSSFSLPPNIIVKQHLPQLQILIHPSVKLFVSHCGANSVTEAQHAGIPIVAIPIAADQFAIASTLVSQGIAEKIDLTNLQPKTVTNTINLLLNNDHYRKNAQQFSKLIRTSGGAAEAVRHLERLASLGSVDLFVPEGFKVSWWVRWHLDIYLTVFLVFLVIIRLIRYFGGCLRCCCCCCYCKRKTKMD